SHPTTRFAMQGNWWGLQTELLYKAFGRISNIDIISGIPGSDTNHHAAPYAITEEFVASYRMHPLMRDDFSFRSLADDHSLRECTFPEIAGPHAQEILAQIPLADLLYSFATLHPGALRLLTYPPF